jgi:hypothetical protein
LQDMQSQIIRKVVQRRHQRTDKRAEYEEHSVSTTVKVTLCVIG